MKMNRYKSYGKGWYFESYKHSLAAKGVKTSLLDRFWGVREGKLENPMILKESLEEEKPSLAMSNLKEAQEYKHAFYNGKLHRRIRWGSGDEKTLSEWKSGKRWDCHDCGAKLGMFHMWLCDNEQSVDGKQMLQVEGAKLRR